MFNRYMLFGGSVYYPVGGMDDFAGSFSTLEAAKDYAENTYIDEDFEWWHVYDTEEDREVMYWSRGNLHER